MPLFLPSQAAIVKDYASSATEVNFPNGTTAYYSSAEGWLTTCFNGTRVPLDSTGAINKKVQVTPLRAVCDTDYNKNITTWTREDMVVYSANQSVPSECWARFADGSSITSTSKGVEVKHELYPTVLVGETEQTVFFDGGVSMIVTEASVEVKVVCMHGRL